MTNIRQELHRLIALNHAEQYVQTHQALAELEDFGDRLIPGLIECLSDQDAEVRVLAVELLVEARPRSNIAVSELIERLDDPDRLVRVAVINNLADFGPIAAGAITQLHQWLDLQDEYLRILATTTIMRMDPYRTELLRDIRDALKSDNANVRDIAREFFGRTKATMPFDEEAFQEAVRSNWNYHAPCEQVDWRCDLQDDETWQIAVAPVFQQLWAGEDDGKKVWAGFDFHIFGLSQEPGVEALDYGAMSFCLDHNPTPFVGIKGQYFGQSFVLRIYLQPLDESEIREIVDTVRHVVRPITVTDDDATP